MAEIKVTKQMITEYRNLIGNFVLSDSAIAEKIKNDIATGKLSPEFALLAGDVQKNNNNIEKTNLFGYGFYTDDETGFIYNEETVRENTEIKVSKDIAENIKDSTKWYKDLNGKDLEVECQRINKDNVLLVLEEFEKDSAAPSLTNIIGDSNLSLESKKDILKQIFNALYDLAKDFDIDVDYFKKTFDDNIDGTEVNAGYSTLGSTKKTILSKENLAIINGVFIGLKETIEIKKNFDNDLVNTLVYIFTNEEETQSQTITSLNYKHEISTQSLDNQNLYDGWAGEFADFISVLWNSDNREKFVREDLDSYKAQIEELENARLAGKEEFEQKFEEIFGVKYDRKLIINYQQAEQIYQYATSFYQAEQFFNQELKVLLSNSSLQDEITTREIDPLINMVETSVTATKEQVYAREFDKLAMFIGNIENDENKSLEELESEKLKNGQETLEKMLETKGITKNSSLQEKYTALREFALEYSQKLHENVMAVTNNKGYDAISKEFDNAYKAAFGVTNDIARRVTEYNLSQMAGAAVVKTTTMIAGTIALGAITGGASLSFFPSIILTSAGAGAITAGVEVTDRLTSGYVLNGLKEHGLSGLEDGIAKALPDEEILRIFKSAAITTATVAAGGFLGAGVEIGAHALKMSVLTKSLVHVGVGTGVGMGAEYLHTGTISIDGVAFAFVLSAIGQIIALTKVGVTDNGKVVFDKQAINQARRYLGIADDVALTDDVLKSAYRKMAIKTHPDKGGSHEAFLRVQQANDLLKQYVQATSATASTVNTPKPTQTNPTASANENSNMPVVVGKDAIAKAPIVNPNPGISATTTVSSSVSVSQSENIAPVSETNASTNLMSPQELANFEFDRYVYANHSDYVKNYVPIRKDLHNRRMEAYGINDGAIPTPRKVSKSQLQAMRDIQCENGEYFNVRDKLRKGEVLNEAEQKFYDSVIKAMEPCSTERTLWRSICNYEGLEEQIRSGIITDNFFSSTARDYSDFYDFWHSTSLEGVENGLLITEGCMLKINVAENTPLLDCNAVYKPIIGKTQNVRMRGEVILPPGNYVIKSYDPELKILEVDFVPAETITPSSPQLPVVEPKQTSANITLSEINANIKDLKNKALSNNKNVLDFIDESNPAQYGINSYDDLLKFKLLNDSERKMLERIYSNAEKCGYKEFLDSNLDILVGFTKSYKNVDGKMFSLYENLTPEQFSIIKYARDQLNQGVFGENYIAAVQDRIDMSTPAEIYEYVDCPEQLPDKVYSKRIDGLYWTREDCLAEIEKVNLLRELLDTQSTPCDITTYRVEGYEILKNVKIGDSNLAEIMQKAIENGNTSEVAFMPIHTEIIVTYNNHIGTSLTQEKIFSSEYPINWEINIPKGSKGLFLESAVPNDAIYNEMEFLLQIGSGFKIQRIEYKNGTWYIKADLIQENNTLQTSNSGKTGQIEQTDSNTPSVTEWKTVAGENVSSQDFAIKTDITATTITKDEALENIMNTLQNKTNLSDLMAHFDKDMVIKLANGDVHLRGGKYDITIEYDGQGNIYKYNFRNSDTKAKEYYIYNSSGKLIKTTLEGYNETRSKIRINKERDYVITNPDLLPKETRDLLLQKDALFYTTDDVDNLSTMINTEEDIAIVNKLLTIKDGRNSFIRVIGNALNLLEPTYNIKNIIKVLNSEKAKEFVLEKIKNNQHIKVSELEPLLNNETFERFNRQKFEDEIDLSYRTKDITLNGIEDVPFSYKSNTEIKEMISSQVPDGEAVCINGKMYCRASDELFPINLSKETFDKLFPVEDRYNITQGSLSDCYFIAELGGFMATPNGRAALYSAFREDGDDIYIKFPHKDNVEIKFKNGKLNRLSPISIYIDDQGTFKLGTFLDHVDACKGIQMIEQAFSFVRRYRFETETKITANNKFFMNRQLHDTDGGQAAELAALFDNHNLLTSYLPFGFILDAAANSIEEGLTILATESKNNPNIIALSGLREEIRIGGIDRLISGHMYRIADYDIERQIVKIVNPYNSSKYIEVPLYVFEAAEPEFYVYKINPLSMK